MNYFKFIFKGFLAFFSIWFLFFSLPSSLFESPKSIVMYDRNNHLMYASVASDEQWRFPKIDSVSFKIEQSVIHFEDEYFRYHLGVNPISIVKSFFLNLKTKEVKRGGSTITMQTIRLLQNNPPRTYLQKFKEVLLAIRFELFNSKNTILEYYVSNAPYGGNIVGVETASWRYFNKSSFNLTWAEAATLAVLPNQPSYIYPGKNQILLLKKRNTLLYKLYKEEVISEMDYQLSIEESLPQKVYKIPNYCYHLAQEIKPEFRNGLVKTTLDITIQKKVSEIIDMYTPLYRLNQINNMSALVIDANTSEILAYVGNVNDTVSGNKINMITRARSSGSTLKPLLYAHMLEDGYLTSQSLLQDIPMDINGYEPNNNSFNFDGLVPASHALTRSLNIPWILALKNYGYEKFYKILKLAGCKHFLKSANHYGLSLVVGGGEIELLELANIFLQMSNKLIGKNQDQLAHFIQGEKEYTNHEIGLSKGAIWLTFDALTNVIRPENEPNWQYRPSQTLAWKTGTSHGYRDAWSVGVNSNYVIAVWVGNSEGNGRSGLTGIKKAAPIMFDILNSLSNKPKSWYQKPLSDLKTIKVCSESGYLPTTYCNKTVSIEYPANSILKEKCPYHTKLFLDSTSSFQVNASCYPIDKMVEKNWFKLPIVEENYYKIVNPLYKPTPPFHPNCDQIDKLNMDIVFPKQNSKIIVSTSNISNKIIFQAIHRTDSARIHWFIDRQFIGSTVSEHKISLDPTQGQHILTIQDNLGNFLTRKFSVIKE